MYCTYFGFRFPPFRTIPHPETFYDGAKRGAMVEALMYGIEHGDGVVKVTGGAGSGKTMLCRVLQARLSGRMPCVYLSHPQMAPRQAMQAIARGLALTAARPYDDPGALVQKHLQAGIKSGRQVVIVVEEAQCVPLPTLEAIRLLCNLDAGTRKAVQLVLLGEPELDKVLAQHEIRQLRDRITHSVVLGRLSREEVEEYLAFRVRSTGHAAGPLFPKPVAHHIARASEGLPRSVNILADRTLMAAFADDTREIALRHAKLAVADTGYSTGGWTDAAKRWWRQRNAALTVLPAGPR